MTCKEILSKISNLEPSPLDENIPDDDKEAAYCKGYNDALTDVMGILNTYPQIRLQVLTWDKVVETLKDPMDDGDDEGDQE
jgi:hypothetical protein